MEFPWYSKKIPFLSQKEDDIDWAEVIVETEKNSVGFRAVKKDMRIVYRPPSGRWVVVRLPKQDVRRLKRIKGVKAVYDNKTICAQLFQATSRIGASAAWRLGYTGQGVGVAVLDTGVSPIDDFTMPENRIVAFHDFVRGRKQPYDDNGHGSHVIGIACGNGWSSQGKYTGIAPKSHIIALKILDENGQGNSAQALAAMEWILANQRKYNINVVNLSIGTNDKNSSLPLVRAVSLLCQKGITVVEAAGNQGSKSTAIARRPVQGDVITVGMWEETFEDQMLGRKRDKKSNYDITAPGKDIVSCLSPDYSFAVKGRDRRTVIDGHYIPMTGTSMATPMVTGAAALIIEKYPGIKPQEVKRLLMENTIDGRVDLEGIFSL